MLSRPDIVASCPECGPQNVDNETLVAVMCPQMPSLNHVQFLCRVCGRVRRIGSTILPSVVTSVGGRVLVLQWTAELDDRARRSKLPAFTLDDLIDWHGQVAEAITLQDWERR